MGEGSEKLALWQSVTVDNYLSQGAVNVRNILISKIDRLSNYAQADPSNIPEDIKLFEIFSGKVTQIIQVWF